MATSVFNNVPSYMAGINSTRTGITSGTVHSGTGSVGNDVSVAYRSLASYVPSPLFTNRTIPYTNTVFSTPAGGGDNYLGGSTYYNPNTSIGNRIFNNTNVLRRQGSYAPGIVRYRDPRFLDPRYNVPAVSPYAVPYQVPYGYPSGAFNLNYPYGLGNQYNAYPYDHYGLGNPYRFPAVQNVLSAPCDPYIDCPIRNPDYPGCYNCVINQGGGPVCASQLCRGKY